MSVIVSNVEVGPCRREVKIEVPAPAVEAESQRVLGEIAKRVQLPGFRRGKVPQHLVQQRYKEDLEHELLERLVPRYWRQAEAEAGLDPLLPPRVGQVEHGADSGLTFVATVEVRPEIELRNVADFALPPVEGEPSREEVAKAIDDLRRARAKLVPVDRPAAWGDFVEGQLTEISADGEPNASEPNDGERRPARFEVGHSQVWEELSLAVTGVAAGREVELTRTHPGAVHGEGAAAAEHGEGAHQGAHHEHRYRFRLDTVQEPELPALDDELAKAVGFDEVGKLTAEIESRLRSAKVADSRRRRERALLDQLVERHPIPLPEWVLENEIKLLLSEYAEELARQGVDVERAAIDWSQLAEEARPQATRRVHGRLLLDAVAEAKAIRVGEDELEATLGALARMQGRSAPVVRRELDEAGKLGPLRAQLRRERTIRSLLGEPDAPPPGGATAESAPGESAG